MFCNGGIHLKQTSLGLGPKLIPPQVLQAGVGGGVHGDPTIGEEKSGAVDVKDSDHSISGSASHSSIDKVHFHVLHPHSGHPYNTSKRPVTFFSSSTFSLAPNIKT